jgi:hypothetical protein
VTRMPRLSRVPTQRRHNVGGDLGDLSDENAKVVEINDRVTTQCRHSVGVTRVTRVTRMPRLLTLFYAQDVQRK